MLEAPRPCVFGTPRISHQAQCELYHRNPISQTRHFAIHVHDYPVAGTKYALRLQCHFTNFISFATMCGPSDDPDSRRPNHYGTETGVHQFWVGVMSLRLRFSCYRVLLILCVRTWINVTDRNGNEKK